MLPVVSLFSVLPLFSAYFVPGRLKVYLALGHNLECKLIFITFCSASFSCLVSEYIAHI